MANKALLFDGTDDFVTITDSASLSALAVITIEMWVKTSSQKDYMCFISKWNHGTASEWVLNADDINDRIRWQLYDQTDGGDFGSQWVAPIYDGAWHYIVAIWDGLTVDAEVNMPVYIDGSLATYDLSLSGGTFTQIRDTATDVVIGRQLALNARDFNGIIDEVRISNAVRTQEEITANWNSGNGKKLEVDGDTVALWHIDEDDGVIFDETVNDNDGTITGASWVAGFPFPYELSCTDGLVFGDTPSTQAILNALATDGISLGDTSLTQAILNVLATDGITLGDVSLANIIIDILVTDGIILGDSPAMVTVKLLKVLKAFTGRNLSDDNGEFRDLTQPTDSYPYTYPFYYAEYTDVRNLS